MRFLPCGREALLVELDGLDAVVDLAADLQLVRPPGVIDLVPAARTVLVRFDRSRTTREALSADIGARTPAAVSAGAPSTVEIPVVYDGADLRDVALATGLAPDEVVRRHSRATYVVAFTGFAPGFGYLAGGDPGLVVPRRRTPRTRVPGGAVALAGEFTGIYPREAPGGWQLIGRTDVVLWDAERSPPALLRPATRVRFTAVGA